MGDMTSLGDYGDDLLSDKAYRDAVGLMEYDESSGNARTVSVQERMKYRILMEVMLGNLASGFYLGIKNAY